MSKAFDCINIGCMLSKLRYYGLADSHLSWFEAYLNHRWQYVLVYKNGPPDISATGELNSVFLRDLFWDHSYSVYLRLIFSHLLHTLGYICMRMIYSYI